MPPKYFASRFQYGVHSLELFQISGGNTPTSTDLPQNVEWIDWDSPTYHDRKRTPPTEIWIGSFKWDILSSPPDAYVKFQIKESTAYLEYIDSTNDEALSCLCLYCLNYFLEPHRQMKLTPEAREALKKEITRRRKIKARAEARLESSLYDNTLYVVQRRIMFTCHFEGCEEKVTSNRGSSCYCPAHRDKKVRIKLMQERDQVGPIRPSHTEPEPVEPAQEGVVLVNGQDQTNKIINEVWLNISTESLQIHELEMKRIEIQDQLDELDKQLHEVKRAFGTRVANLVY